MQSRWKDEEAGTLTGWAPLVYGSRLVGSHDDLALWGGGNTSFKLEEAGPDGRPVRVLRVKGSGSNLKDVTAGDFPGLRLADIEGLFARDAMSDPELAKFLADHRLDPASPRPSIETLLHGFTPWDAVIHTHPDALLSLTNTARGEALTREALGPDARWVPFMASGFAMSKRVGEEVRAHPGASCVVLEKHGLVTFGRTVREAYQRTLEVATLAERAVARKQADRPHPFGPARRPEAAPEARRRILEEVAGAVAGLVYAGHHCGIEADDRPAVMEFVNSEAAETLCQAGPATPGHVLAVKRFPVWVDPDRRTAGGWTEAVQEGLAEYHRRDQAYGRACDPAGLPAGADRRPRVVLVPGAGMLAVGPDERAARMAGEVYRHIVAVMRGAQTVDRYQSVEDAELFAVEFHSLYHKT